MVPNGEHRQDVFIDDTYMPCNNLLGDIDLAHGEESHKKFNVLIVTPVFPPNFTVGGGVAVTVGALTDKLVQRGCNVSVLSPRLGNVDYGTSSLYPSFPVQFPTIYNLKLFYKSIKDADIVICPDSTVVLFLATICHFHSKPLWFNLHTNIRHLLEMTGPFGLYVSAPICDGFTRLCSHLTAATYTTSPSYKNVLLERGYRVDGVFSPKIKLAVFEESDSAEAIAAARLWLTRYIPMGINNSLVGRHTLFIYAGRFSHEKRIELLAKTLPDYCCLAIVGDGHGAACDKVVALHNPANGVFVHRGMVDQARLRILYKAVDFLVSASEFETLGMTVAEANVCGTPVIVQRATGFSTQVLQGKNGFLVNFEDEDAVQLEIAHAVANRPSKAAIKKTMASETFWSNKLVNLDDEVLKLAYYVGSDKSKWRSSKIPVILLVLLATLFWVCFWIIGFPFNKISEFADRTKKPGPVVFSSNQGTPKRCVK